MISSAEFVPAYDHWLFEARCYLETVLTPGRDYDKNSMIRTLCREMHIQWSTAENVLVSLTRAGFLVAGYGTYSLTHTHKNSDISASFGGSKI